MAAELDSAGIPAAVFSADLSSPTLARGVVRAIQDALGRIDVVHYGPLAGNQRFFPAISLDVATQQSLLDLFFLTPIAVIQAVLPAMIDQGDGAILISQGLTAADPIAGMSGLGPAMAATRNYVYSLFGELREKGVYAGTVTIKASIDRSEMNAAMRSSRGSEAAVHSIDPDALADRLWELVVERDRPEVAYPA